jgi:sarcosine oxidase subunit beta
VVPLPARTEVVVVGGGVVGVAIAYWLARLGTAPLLLEARDLAWGASGRNAGVVLAGRSSLEDARTLREVLRAEAIEADYEEHGHLALASSAKVLEAFRQEVAGRPVGAPPLHVLDRAECTDLLRLRLSPRFHGGRWLPSAAAIDPVRFVRGLADAAERHGATIATGTRVHAVRSGRRGGVTVITGRARVEAGSAVVACNVGSARLLPLRGLLRPFRGQMLSTRPTKRRFWPGMAVDRGTVYWRQAEDGTIVLGGCRTADSTAEASAREAVNPRIQAALEAFLPRAFPDLPAPVVERRWAGIMDETPDGRPLVGRWPGESRRWLAVGLGGHGLPPALGIGRSLAQAVVNGHVGAELGRFRPDRFAELAA